MVPCTTIMTKHRVIFGDARKMPEIETESLHFVVTSPPYWSIKDYSHPAQIGYRQSYGEYLADLRSVFAEAARVLAPGCRMAINIGDQYLRASEHGRYRVQPIPADISVMCRDIGLDFMGNIIWRKISTTRTSGGGQWMGSMYYPKDGHITYEHEYILLFRKPGRWVRPPKAILEKSRLTRQQRGSWFRGIWDDIAPVRQSGHVAMFPPQLPERLIRMYTFYGETVLDPFLGSGTTAAAALRAGRNSVGYEINSKFRSLIEDRFADCAHDLYAPTDVHISFEQRE